MGMMDFRKTEDKWRKKWEAAKLFECDPKKGKKFFTSNVIPYVNGNAHIGHSYTFTRTDVYARFKRMQGFNTLFAQGFHATGEPIVGTIERLKNNDESQINTFKLFGATDKDIEDFKKKGAKYVALYWAKKMEESFRLIGFSTDWRRKFTLSVTPQFSSFVQWQYNTLKSKGYVVQGTHPVVWCPKDQSPTGDHDRLEGEGESPVEYILVKFKMGDAFLPAATLRPETIYGVTNIWLNPHADYVLAQVDKEKWIISREAVEKVKDHIKEVKIISEFDEKNQLIGSKCVNPVTGREITVLPGDFVDTGTATGIVMSVPAHAPFDYIELKELIEKNELEHYGLARQDVEPITLIKSEFGEAPAKVVSDQFEVTSTSQKDKLDEATSLLYKKEFHTGVMNGNCGPYANMRVSEAKEQVIKDFIEKGISERLYDVKNVVCRCTTRCHVKILENQWFLKYSDGKWKNVARGALKDMKIYPEEARNNFSATLDWLKDKACARRSGLGTQMPWDKSWIVETLSDSTVYMAYYTIAHIITKNKIPGKKLTHEVFDYVMLGKGTPTKIARKSKINVKYLKAMRKEFDYFYPLDFRNSAKDLVQNHLTFMMYQHAAIWPKSKWPHAIAVNGYVNVEGEKMSKSRGNIIPLKDLIETYGADMTRINIATSSEGIDDADWRVENINGFRIRYDYLYYLARDAKNAKRAKMEPIDKYLVSRMQKIILHASENMETTKFRTASNYALFEATNELKWYVTRCSGIKNANKKVLADTLSSIIRLVAPFTPFVCEELWTMLGKKGFVSVADWPRHDSKLVDDKVESGEQLIKQTIDDIREIQQLLKIKPKLISIFVAEDWKYDVYDTVLKNRAIPANELIRTVMATDLKKYGNATISFIQSLYKKIHELKPVLPKSQQLETLKQARSFIEGEIGCTIGIIDASSSSEKKARTASPMKPGLLLG